MANRKQYFFYAPSWDYPPPPAGPIRLGNVITSLTSPERPLHTAVPTESEVFSVRKSSVETSTQVDRHTKVAIVTKFLSILGLGVDAGINLETSNHQGFNFDVLETTQFIPSPSYVQEDCIKSSPVTMRWLKTSRYRKPLYVITGLKIVRGAKTAVTHQASGVGVQLGLEVDGTVWSGGAVPLAGGPELDVGRSKSQEVSWKESGDFILAYRVRKVKVDRKTNGVIRDEDYTKGAMLEADSQRISDDVVDISEDEQFELEDQDWEMISVLEGEEIIDLAIPKLRQH